MTTPDGTIVSYVVQQGDCNAPDTCQALMNHLFSPYISQWMDVYLDDIVIYSDSLEEHVQHVKMVIDILEKEKFYLSRRKLRFLERELKVLGHIIDNDRIQMDLTKVDGVLAWKVPMN
jgi:Reverse transcriptase (RNA-dependent DNA polymerase)